LFNRVPIKVFVGYGDNDRDQWLGRLSNSRQGDMKDGHTLKLKHQLVLRYEDGTPTRE
jgi:hypothetical protein